MTGDGGRVVEELSAEEAFALVGHETRFAILAALQEAGGTMTFSRLREAIDVRDSGRFNYHLDKLTGQFVRQSEDGYAITPPGERLVGAVLSGGYTASLGDETVPVDGGCLECGGPLEARIRDQHIEVRCRTCESTVTNPEIPAGLVAGQPAADAPSIVGRWSRVTLTAAEAGICLTCYGPRSRSIELATDEDVADWIRESGIAGMVYDDCERCGDTHNAAVEIAVLTHPRVVAYHHDHGIDLRTTPPWALPWLIVGCGTVESTDPVRVAVSMPLDDESRTFVFDADLELIDTRQG